MEIEDIDKIAKAVKECKLNDETEDASSQILLCKPRSREYNQQRELWPSLKKSKVPAIFLHKPALDSHIQKNLSKRIEFYKPTISRNYTKINCVTIDDHRALTKYLEQKQLPYHTYGNPSKRKLKVVVRGLPKDIELEKVKKELKSMSIPVIRIHEMKTKNCGSDKILILVVVPHDCNGLRLIFLQKLFGHIVNVEPPKNKPTQCYRCQKWGHTERYCHGELRCVKCAGEHSYKKCPRTKDTKDPPLCANCGGSHTANYKKCPQSPFSISFEIS